MQVNYLWIPCGSVLVLNLNYYYIIYSHKIINFRRNDDVDEIKVCVVNAFRVFKQMFFFSYYRYYYCMRSPLQPKMKKRKKLLKNQLYA